MVPVESIEEIHIQDENSDNSGRCADLALARTAIGPVVATRLCVRGAAGLGAGGAGSVIAARLSNTLSLRNV